MSVAGNALNNNNLSVLGHKAGAQVTAAIRQASAKTGVDFAYLMNQAAVESGFKSDAKAKTSSASGLYQFIEKTWMRMVKEHGDKYGLGQFADKIDAKGRVADPQLKRQILALRNDPQTAAAMAAEFAADNQCYLEKNTSCKISSTELYLAHFMGAGGAAGFLNAMQKNPMESAADIFPEAANANRAVFFSKSGAPRSLAEVYDFFAKKFEGVSGEAGKTSSSVAKIQPHDAFDISALLDSSANDTTTPPPLSPHLMEGGGQEGGNDVPIWQQWSTPSPAFTRSSLSVDPVQIMMLAQLETTQPRDATAR